MLRTVHRGNDQVMGILASPRTQEYERRQRVGDDILKNAGQNGAKWKRLPDGNRSEGWALVLQLSRSQ